jgi:hypothetical protein
MVDVVPRGSLVSLQLFTSSPSSQKSATAAAQAPSSHTEADNGSQAAGRGTHAVSAGPFAGSWTTVMQVSRQPVVVATRTTKAKTAVRGISGAFPEAPAFVE